jgi:hypothetical protein
MGDLTIVSSAPPPQVQNSARDNAAAGSNENQPSLVNLDTEALETAGLEAASAYSPSSQQQNWRGVMRRCIDFLDSKAFNAPLVGAVALVTFGQMDYDWHAIALSLFTVAGYWLIFRRS